MTTPTTMFRSVLVANRGEIARRVFATARARGIETVAVYADADADAAHVAAADIAVHLPGETVTDTYLDAEKLIAAARSSGAEAIHPGYGFLSENAEFARAVTDAGLVWIGPSPEAIEAMGSKIAAKERMGSVGVPILTDLSPDTVTEEQLPVLVKASAGGGGRGMRVVRSLADLEAEIASAQNEAASAFGDGAVFCERYLETGRHIEVQIMADRFGTVWAVGERECSIQRRHQKVIEEAPSPLVEQTPGMRERLFTAARDAARAIGYTGAGTVEFLATDRGEFFFLEMNTRLQVEHPVTEATTGTDLVALQFDVAAGRTLPSAEPPTTRGWAIEARLYAEDPAHDWRPTAGTLHHLDFPQIDTEFDGPFSAAGSPSSGSRPRIRVDSAVDTSAGPAEVSTLYDPMLAKVIAAAETRADAAAALARTLSHTRIDGLLTNRDLLVSILRDEEFLRGHTTTAFLSPQRLATLAASPLGDHGRARAAAIAVLATEYAAHRSSGLSAVRVGFRAVGTARTNHVAVVADTEYVVTVDAARAGLTATSVEAQKGDDVSSAIQHGPLSLESPRWSTPATAHGQALTARVVDNGITTATTVFIRPESSDVDGPITVDVVIPQGTVSVALPPRFPQPGAEASTGSLLAPMPGTVIRIGAAIGQQVQAGDPLVWMEAMKMEHAVRADTDGTVADLPVAIGQTIAAGTVLAVVDPTEGE